MRTRIARPHGSLALALSLLLMTNGCSSFRAPAPDQLVQMPRPTAAAAVPSPGPEASDEPSLSPAPAEAAARTQYFLGTGEATARPRRSAAGAVTTTGGDVTLNFVNTDIRDVIKVIVGDILRLTYAVDARVQGSVTLQTSQPVDRSALLPILEDALRLNGMSLVRANEVYTIIPTGEAARHVTQIGTGTGIAANTQGYSIQIVPLRFTAADELQAMLKSVLPADTAIRTIPSRNLLVIAGAQREIAGVLELVAMFDVSWFAGMSFALYYPKNVDAKVLIGELDTVFGATRDGASPIRFAPIERLNAILALTRTPVYLREAAAWVERLDQGSETVDERVFIYYVQNGRATNLAASLNSLFGRKPDSSGSAPRRADTGADKAMVPAAILAQVTPGTSYPPAPPPPLAAAPRPQAAPEPREPLASPSATEAQGIRLGGRAAPQITADEDNNALLILATPREYRTIRTALAQLDLPPLQVLIEAVVAEVTLTNDLRYGVQWFFRLGSTSFTLSNAVSGAVQPEFPGLAVVGTSGNSIRAVLSSIESLTKIKVLSSPQLMVLNNQTAMLQVGDQVPIASQSATSILVPNAPVVNTIQYRDTGVILNVTPRVNEGGLVLMEISQQVSDVALTTTSGIDSPTIQQRKVNSSVSVQNGETIALGGLIRDRRVSDDTGIPVLKDIPVFGALFKTVTNTDTRTELVILITPRVVRSQADIRRLSEEFRERLRSMSFMPPQ